MDFGVRMKEATPQHVTEKNFIFGAKYGYSLENPVWLKIERKHHALFFHHICSYLGTYGHSMGTTHPSGVI